MRLTATVIGHICVIILCLYFSYQIFISETPWIFLDGLNLLIHEAGHMIFWPLGEFMHFLGGSLSQILFPCSFFVYFLQRKEYFSVSFIFFWIADNIINVSIYMKDAQAMILPLLGGDGAIHDWNWLFSYMNLLQQTQIIGGSFYLFGTLCLIVSIISMGLFTIKEVFNT